MQMQTAAGVLAIAFSLSPVRVTTPPLGRAPRPPERGLKAPRMWQDKSSFFAIERPAGDR